MKALCWEEGGSILSSQSKAGRGLGSEVRGGFSLKMCCSSRRIPTAFTFLQKFYLLLFALRNRENRQAAAGLKKQFQVMVFFDLMFWKIHLLSSFTALWWTLVSIYPSIFHCLSGPGGKHQRRPMTLDSGHFQQLLQVDTKAFSGQSRVIISTSCPGSTQGSPELLHLAPLDTEEQLLYQLTVRSWIHGPLLDACSVCLKTFNMGQNPK